jgi:hypothetical protein
VKAVDTSALRQKHEWTSSRNDANPVLPTKLDCVVADSSSSRCTIHPNAAYASLGAVAHNGIRIFG